MEKKRPSRPPVFLILIFLGLAAGIIVVGYQSYEIFARKFRAEVERQLSAIVDLKVSELVQWRKERLGDGSILFNNPAFSGLVARYLENPQNTEAGEQLQIWLKRIYDYHQYSRISLFDRQGSRRLTVPEDMPPVSATLQQLISQVLRSKEVVFQDFYLNEHDQRIYLAVLIPVIDTRDVNRVLGVMVLRIDPRQHLYPFLKRWPTPSRTAETFLMRREGGEAVFLSELRFNKNAPLAMHAPLSRTDMPAVMAVLGREGLVEGVDYRGVPVIAEVRPVPDSPWFMVARMDKEEIFAPLKQRLGFVLSLVASVIVSAGLCILLLWRQQRVLHYRGMLAVQNELRLTLESIGDGLYSLDAGWRFVFMNKKAEQMLGLSLTDVFGKNFWDIFPPAAGTPLEQEYRAAAAGEVRDYDNFYEPWGRWFNNRCFPREGGGISVYLQEITGRKKMETALRNSEERFRTLMKLAPLPMCYLSNGGEFSYINDRFTKVLGYTPEDVPDIGRWWGLAYPDKDYRRRVMETWESAVGRSAQNAADIDPIEYRVTCKDGSVRIMEISGIAMENGVLATFIDLTERKQAETELRQSREWLTMAQEAAHVGSWEWDLQTGKNMWSDNLWRLYGLEPNSCEASYDGWLSTVHPDDRERAARAVISATETGGELSTEWRVLLEDGSTRWLMSRGQPVKNSEGGIARYLGIVLDITGRKRAEEALNDSRQLLLDITNNSLALMYVLDAEGRFLLANKKLADLFGTTPEALIGKTRAFAMPPETVAAHRENDMRVLQSRSPEILEEENEEADGRHVYLTMKYPLFRNDGTLYAVGGMSLDITDRKRIGEQLALSEERLRLAIDTVSMGTFDWDLASGRIIWSAWHEKLLGYGPGEFDGSYAMFERRVHPDDLPLVNAEIERCRIARERYACEFRVVWPDGSVHWIAGAGRYIYDESGIPVHMHGVVTEITGRKEAEQRLRFQSDLLDQSYDGIFTWELGGEIQYWNKGSERLYGILAEDALGKVSHSLLKTQFPTSLKEIKRQLKQKCFWEGELRHMAGNGRQVIVDSRMTLVEVGGRQLVIESNRDITERKKIEEALRQSESTMRSVFITAPVGICFMKDRVYQKVNKSYCEMFGYPEEELIARTTRLVYESDEEFDRVGRELYADLQERGQVTVETSHRCRDGSKREIIMNLAPIFQDDLSAGVVAIIYDITERKRAEEALKQSEAAVRKKLAAILEPEGDLGELSLSDIIDCQALREIMEDYYRFSNITSAVVDSSGNLLIAVGFQDICTRFHRAHPETSVFCRESDVELAAGAQAGSFKAYRCKNHLWDVATPIVVGGRHMGNFYIGQFFFRDEAPDREHFKGIARRYGFNEEEYLAALDRVPRFDRDTVEVAMAFYTKLSAMISNLSYSTVSLGRALTQKEAALSSLEKSEAKLRKSNEELTQFMYAMSHDLKSPVVTVKTFAGYLEKDLQKKDSERVRKDIAFIRGSADKMGRLIDDLLQLTRMGSQKSPAADMDVRGVVRDALLITAGRIAERSIQVEVMREPLAIRGERTRLVEVFQNLIDNAAKFTGDRKNGCIAIGWEVRDGMPHLFVRDNGIGIDPRHHQKLFGLFEKLDPESEGTGMGLALAKRIVELHGGRIWVESEGTGKGSCFWFTLPGKQTQG